MTDLTIRDIFDLPPAIPRCIVRIQDFDDEQTLQENIRDYVVTDRVGAEMARLVDRIVTSCGRQEACEGHYLHGSLSWLPRQRVIGGSCGAVRVAHPTAADRNCSGNGDSSPSRH
jgi:hypothetical protein